MYGISVPPPHTTNEEHVKVYKVLKEVVDKLLNQIYMCLTFYEARCYGVKVGKIFIIGGGSMLKVKRIYGAGVTSACISVGLLDIDGIDINKNLNGEKLNFLVNAVGITL